jgi:hypothetical protein
VKAIRVFRFLIFIPTAAFFLGAPPTRSWPTQDRSQKPAENGPDKVQEKTKEKSATKAPAKLPAEIELLETRIRFEADGGSRKEVHARVKINDELGVRQFARLNFDFNRSFEQVEIPLVRITHARGGTVDVLPSAITDTPNPAVVNAPAYQDVRVKSVRILGLAPNDTLEYRVITTVSHHPLAPDFWLEHTFDRTGVVSRELFELDLPTLPNMTVHMNPATPADPSGASDSKTAARSVVRWTRKQSATPHAKEEPVQSAPDISITTFSSWNQLADRLSILLNPSEQQSRALWDRASSLTSKDAGAHKNMADIYDFVSKKIRTLDLPVGATGFRSRPPAETLASGYGTPEDKFTLFAALGNNFFGPARAGFVSSSGRPRASESASPGEFDHVLTMSGYPSINVWMDLNIEVSPFRVVPMQFRGKQVFFVGPSVENRWETLDAPLPFPSSQIVTIKAELDLRGQLSARVSYAMRGDNELLLRVAFHQTPKENWKNVAQLLALSDGFRGQITNVNASDPYETQDPFNVEYEITQPKFVDWSKKPLRIPALLPLLGLPDPAGKASNGSSASLINLGTPLDVEVSASIHLPAGTTAHIPTGTSVERDFATYASQYSAKDSTLTASRHLNFILREIPADRAADYNAFLRAVQNDESQVFQLERVEAPPAKPQKP